MGSNTDFIRSEMGSQNYKISFKEYITERVDLMLDNFGSLFGNHPIEDLKTSPNDRSTSDPSSMIDSMAEKTAYVRLTLQPVLSKDPYRYVSSVEVLGLNEKSENGKKDFSGCLENSISRIDVISSVLLVTVKNILYPITEDVLRQVFLPYGYMEKLVIIQQFASVQALVHYQTIQCAVAAKAALQGRCIYDGCCELDIQLSILENSVRRIDELVKGKGVVGQELMNLPISVVGKTCRHNALSLVRERAAYLGDGLLEIEKLIRAEGVDFPSKAELILARKWMRNYSELPDRLLELFLKEVSYGHWSLTEGQKQQGGVVRVKRILGGSADISSEFYYCLYRFIVLKLGTLGILAAAMMSKLQRRGEEQTYKQVGVQETLRDQLLQTVMQAVISNAGFDKTISKEASIWVHNRKNNIAPTTSYIKYVFKFMDHFRRNISEDYSSVSSSSSTLRTRLFQGGSIDKNFKRIYWAFEFTFYLGLTAHYICYM